MNRIISLFLLFLIQHHVFSQKLNNKPLQKRRMKLNNILNQYVNNREGAKQGVRNSGRQSEVPEVQCAEDFTASCATNRNKDEYMMNMFESYNFRLNQVENNNQKYLRIQRFAKLMKSKGEKYNDFQNTTAWLLAVLGGDISNPTCNGISSGAESEAIQILYNNITQESLTIFLFDCLIFYF